MFTCCGCLINGDPHTREISNLARVSDYLNNDLAFPYSDVVNKGPYSVYKWSSIFLQVRPERPMGLPEYGIHETGLLRRDKITTSFPAP